MKPEAYEVTASVSGFSLGETLNVVARYGHAHANEMVLEPDPFAADSVRVVVTDEQTGFSERDILAPSSRFGDWQAYDRTFDAGGDPTERDDPVVLTSEELSSIAAPVEARV